MKKTIRLITLFLVAALILATLSACSAKDVVIAEKGAPIASALLYGEPRDITNAAATDFRDLLVENGFSRIDRIYQHSLISEESEIVIGESDREASRIASERVTKLLAEQPDDFHWAFCYKDGTLAIVASSAEAYGMAFGDFFSRYIIDSKIVIKDGLKEEKTVTLAERDEYLAEQELLAEERKKQENAKILASLLPLVEDQRNELKTYAGKISKYSDSSTTLLFNNYSLSIGSSKWGSVPYSLTDEHPRLLVTSEQIPALKAAIKDDTVYAEEFQKMLESEIKNGCILPSLDSGAATVNSQNAHNYNDEYLEIIQAKALGYLVYGDELYGYQAIYYMKNYLKSLDIKQIASDQCRQYGYVMFTTAIVYDWCYGLLEPFDKIQFMSGVENCLCRGKNASGVKMEVGFPPLGQGAVSGHGSEFQVLRDYLAFAIAIYDENPSWWEYIGARVYNDYLPVRNYYYQSGITHQGTGYVTTRHMAELYSAWLLTAATGTNPYVGMDKVLRSLIGYEFAPGMMFNDGDGGGDYKDTRSLVSMAYISAYLHSDATVLAQAEHLNGSAPFGSHYGSLNNPLFLALTSISDLEPADGIYEGLSLIQYNGSPLGQYVIRASWSDDSSAAVFMRIKERTTANHEHCDAGTFEIYYKGMLTSDGGAYNNYAHAHTRYYHQATISHNGLIIYNPEKASSQSGWYSGGQRWPGETAYYSVLLTSTYETGSVTGQQHAYSDSAEKNPLYAYIAGDISKAYDSGTVSYAGRRMLTVYTDNEEFPMAFFVYDDVSSTKKECEKRFLLQISSPSAPQIDSESGTVVTENGNGRLVLTCLSDSVKINGVGGRTYVGNAYDASKSQNYLVNGKQLAPQSSSDDDGHWGRVEIVWDKESTDASFMNVIYVTDKGNTNVASVTGISEASGLSGGVFNRSIAALFATSRSRADSVLSCTTDGGDAMSYYVSGVAAGKWAVSVNGQSIGTFTATEEGGLLTFTAPAGEITITPSK